MLLLPLAMALFWMHRSGRRRGGGVAVQRRRWLDGGDVLAVARTVASVDFPPLAASPVDRLGFGGGETVAAANLVY